MLQSYLLRSIPHTAWHLATHCEHTVDISILKLHSMGKINLQFRNKQETTSCPLPGTYFIQAIRDQFYPSVFWKYWILLEMWFAKTKLTVKAFLYLFFILVQLSILLCYSTFVCFFPFPFTHTHASTHAHIRTHLLPLSSYHHRYHAIISIQVY